MKCRPAVQRPHRPFAFGVRAARDQTAATGVSAGLAGAKPEQAPPRPPQKRQKQVRLEYGAQSGREDAALIL